MSNNSTPKFTRRKEDFICFHCGVQVSGNGYTDHCPSCLWSKHVDINPGDRAADCGGEMEPIGLENKGKKQIIHYQCLKCGHRYKVKINSADNFEKILELSSKPIK